MRYQKETRRSRDDVWPLRRADGRPWHDPTTGAPKNKETPRNEPPPVETLPSALIERLAACIPGNKNDIASIEMILDLEGYDTTDPAWVKACRKRAAWVIRDERASA